MVPAVLSAERYHVHVPDGNGFDGLTYAIVEGNILPVKYSGQDERFWQALPSATRFDS